MGVIVNEFEITLSNPPSRLFKAFVLDIDNFVPKVLPLAKSFDIIQVDGGAGTLKRLTYIEGDQVKTAKQRIDLVDETNYVYKYAMLEGDVVGEDFELFTLAIKFEPGSDGGSVYKYSTEFHTKGDNHQRIQETIKQREEKSKTIIHAVEAYLLAHPHEYN